MRIAIACDHAGFVLKATIAKVIADLGHEIINLGTDNPDVPVDYPDMAEVLGKAIQAEEADRGILICGSGVGGAIAASKMNGIRASVCHDSYSAAQGVEHDDMNVLCLGGRIIGSALAIDLAKAFLFASFSGEERHIRRLNKVKALEQQ
ncbi:RpiB/LacA/LacB family sugar-phosphate isomerase [Gemmatimonadota bacterium]